MIVNDRERERVVPCTEYVRSTLTATKCWKRISDGPSKYITQLQYIHPCVQNQPDPTVIHGAIPVLRQSQPALVRFGLTRGLWAPLLRGAQNDVSYYTYIHILLEYIYFYILCMNGLVSMCMYVYMSIVC